MSRENRATAGTVVDLFCGCGGFSLGAELAGFHSLAAIDIDPTLQSAYRKNFPGTKAVQASVADLDAAAWRQIIGRVRPDGLIGGPPCQGFSWIGRRRKNDPRNNLLHHFYRNVMVLRPKFFIMENVLGLLDEDNAGILKDAIEQVTKHYQIVGPFTVNAAHFGAATNRRRTVVIGYDPNDIAPLTVEILSPKIPKKLITVRDAIGDLPSPIPDPKDDDDFGWARFTAKSADRASTYAKTLRRPPRRGLGWNEAIDRHREGYVSGLTETRHSKTVARRYTLTPGGKSDPVTKSYRLQWHGQCPTLRAGTDIDKGAFQAVRPLHPGKGRVITVREAARLQSFPDWFIFHTTKWHSFRMIGNSVSPAVSQGLIARIAAHSHVTLAS
jgi:DNA (cytosine-5)-methyltransferase 1